MKKLKIIFPLFLISLLLIPKVYARTNYNFTTNSFYYIDKYLTNHSGKTISDFYNMIFSNINYEPPNSNYICNYTDGYLDCFSSNSSFVVNSYYSNGTFLNLYNPNPTVRIRYTITFNNSGEYVSSTSQTWNFNALNNIAYAQPSSSSKLWSLPVASNFTSILFDNSSLGSSIDKIQNLLFNNLSTSYSVDSYVPLSAFSKGSSYGFNPINYYGINVETSTCNSSQIGEVIGIRNFSLITEDIINKDSPVIENSFFFYSPETNFPADYYWIASVQLYPENDYDTHYELNCIDNTGVTGLNGSNCLLTYYFTTDSLDSINVGSSFEVQKNIPTYQESLVSHIVVDSVPPSCNFQNVKVRSGVDTSDSIDVIQEQITNSNTPNNLSIFNNLSSLLPPGPVDSILTIPLQMLNAINNFLGDNCTPITVNLPFVNQNIQLKCIRSFYSDINANTFVEGVGSVASVVILVQYFISLYNWIEDHMQLSHKKLKSWGAGEV